jgi:hypothetical protein
MRLVTLQAKPAPFDLSKGEAGLPTRMLVLPWGDNATAKGQIIVNATTLSQMPGFQAKMNWDRVALDFEHNSVPSSAAYQGEPVKLAGYGTLDLVEGEGLYLSMTSWTADGKTMAGGGHYGDLSAAVITNDKNEVVGCHSVALCRHGATPGVTLLSIEWPSIKDQRPPADANEFLAAMQVALGLPHDAAPSVVADSLLSKLMSQTKTTDTTAAAAAKTETPAAAAAAAETPDPVTLSSVMTTLEAMRAEIKTLTSDLAATKAQAAKDKDDAERAEIIALCASQGKELPASAKDLPVATLKELSAQLPVTIPMERRTPLVTLASPTAPQHDEVSKLTGVSPEDRKKYGSV